MTFLTFHLRRRLKIKRGQRRTWSENKQEKNGRCVHISYTLLWATTKGENSQNQPYFCFTNLIERVNKFWDIERKRPIYVSGTDSVLAYVSLKDIKTELSFVKVLDKVRSYHLNDVLWDPVLIRPTCQFIIMLNKGGAIDSNDKSKSRL